MDRDGAFANNKNNSLLDVLVYDSWLRNGMLKQVSYPTFFDLKQHIVEALASAPMNRTGEPLQVGVVSTRKYRSPHQLHSNNRS